MSSLAEMNLTAGYYIKLTDSEQAQPLLQRLCSPEEDTIIDAVSRFRLIITCSQQQKLAALHLRIPERLIEILKERNLHTEDLLVQILHALSSLAALGPEAISHLFLSGLLPLLMEFLGTGMGSEQSQKSAILSASVRCIRVVIHNGTINQVYEVVGALLEQPERMHQLLVLMKTSQEVCQVAFELFTLLSMQQFPVVGVAPSSPGDEGPRQQAVADMSGAYCEVLVSMFPIASLLQMLASDRQLIKRAALMFISTCLQSSNLQRKFISICTPHGIELGRRILQITDLTEPSEFRLLAFNIVTLFSKTRLPLCEKDFLLHKVLPLLARLCRKTETAAIRIGAAETLTYLVDDDISFQELASYTDQLLSNLADYLKPSLHTPVECPFVILRSSSGIPGSKNVKNFKEKKRQLPDIKENSQELKRAAFLAFSALASSNEQIRKRVSDIDGLVNSVVAATGDSNLQLVYAALRLLLSLSRSVQQLRTVFKDHNVWETVLVALKANNDNQITCIASAMLVNLTVEFSPNQQVSGILEQVSTEVDSRFLQNLIDNGFWPSVGALLTHQDELVVENGIWTLMNITYESTARIKKSVEQVAPHSVLDDLLKHPHKQVVLRAVGLIRNLFHTTPIKENAPPNVPQQDIATRILRRLRGHSISMPSDTDCAGQAKDVMESTYGQDLYSSLLSTLTATTDVEVQEQCLCAIGNVCASPRGQNDVITNPDALNLIKRGLQQPEPLVQSAAVFCVANLAKADSEETAREREDKQFLSAVERQRVLIELNFQRELQRLLPKDDRLLLGRVKTALQHFNGIS